MKSCGYLTNNLIFKFFNYSSLLVLKVGLGLAFENGVLQ